MNANAIIATTTVTGTHLTVSDYASIVAAASQVCLVIGLVFTWKQLKIAIEDIKLRSLREAGNLSMAQARIFSEEIIPEYLHIYAALGNSPQECPKISVFSQQDELNEETRPEFVRQVRKMQANSELSDRVLFASNKLEAFAMTFVQKLADEQMVFDSIGRSFCNQVETLFFQYCVHRKDSSYTIYPNTRKLYEIWKNRLECITMSEKRDSIEQAKILLESDLKKASEQAMPIRPIGRDIA